MIDLKNVFKTMPDCENNPDKLNAVLRDLYPEEKAKTRIITDILKAEIPEKIKNNPSDSFVIERAVTLLENDYGYGEKVVRDCLRIWCNVYCADTATVAPNVVESKPSEAVPVQIPQKKNITPTEAPLNIDNDEFSIENGVLEKYKGNGSNVVIPNGVTSIGDIAFLDNIFFGNSDLKSVIIPYSVTNIGKRAFNNCRSLESIIIPDSVSSIGDLAFCGCSSLESIDVDINNKKYYSDNGVLYNKNKTELICCPARKTNIAIPDSVTCIDKMAFFSCKWLTSIIIPDSVTSICDGVFSQCSGLTSITIPDSVTSIGNRAFIACSSLESIELPDSITSIGEYAFCNCKNLTSITIPDNVISIGDCAFKDCWRLTSITIPNSVTNIGEDAFKFFELILKVKKGSYAEEYAKANNLSIQYY